MRVVTVCLVVVFALGGAPYASADTTGSPSAPWGYGGSTGTTSHPMPMGPRAQSAPAGAHLTYFGGPVISNVSVQGVYWGSASPTDYEAGVGPGQTATLGSAATRSSASRSSSSSSRV